VTLFGQVNGDHGTIVPQGAKVIAAEESRANVAYGLMATPDRVPGVVMPQDGLLCVRYSALVKNSMAGTGAAAIFVGATQLRSAVGGGAPDVFEFVWSSGANEYDWLFTVPPGAGSLFYWGMRTGGGDASRGAVPVAVGGSVEIEVPAGTYDVSVQFRSSSGSVTAKERKLWVWTMDFTRSSVLPPV
jgi:hypothetical protein